VHDKVKYRTSFTAWCGIGKSVSRGFGTVKRVKESQS
jgi:CRISPR/Cas system CSM-associated protein Csm3 (group 7 of RAMP superfamily)